MEINAPSMKMVMRAIELLGTKVAPRVRDEIAWFESKKESSGGELIDG